MFQDRLLRLEQQEKQMQEMMQKSEAEKAEERDRLVEAIRLQLMGDLQTLVARQALTKEVSRT